MAIVIKSKGGKEVSRQDLPASVHTDKGTVNITEEAIIRGSQGQFDQKGLETILIHSEMPFVPGTIYSLGEGYIITIREEEL